LPTSRSGLERHIPPTDSKKKSSVFPNFHKFVNVLHLLIDCIQMPSNTVRGFNLDDCVRDCSTALNIDLELIGARCNVNDQYPWVINNTSGLHQTAIPSQENDNAQVYHSPKRVLTRNQRIRMLNSEAAASNKKLKTDENEVVADDVEIERIGHGIAPLAASLAVLHEEIAITPSKLPDWLPPDWLTKFWPLGDYHEMKAVIVDNSRLRLLPVQVAITSLSIPACSRILLKLGAQRFYHDIMLSDEASPLYLAAKVGNPLLLSWMLKNGGKIVLEVENRDGKTPIFAAAYYGGLVVTKILILYGAAMTGSRFFNSFGGNSVLEFMALDAVEKLRKWTKSLIHDKVEQDPQRLSFLIRAHRLILEYYYGLSKEDDIEEGTTIEVDLESMDHGRHDFLKDKDPDKEGEIQKAEAADLKRSYLDLYKLCYYGEK